VDEPDATIAYILARMTPPDFPMPIGIFREVMLPTFDRLVHEQIQAAVQRGPGDIEKLIRGPETWEIKR
jgi:2-oxoglutarate ferredoxin oxidoreductase subunit beta